MSTLTDLITKVADYDPDLSDALKTEFRIYAQRRPFGLNFERHQPENVRLYGRPAHVGDLVNILPPRGTQEGPENRKTWRITAITDGRAELLGTGTEEDETTTADVADLVTLSEFDKPIYPGLKETGRVERGGDKPYQVVINAENYHALKALLYPYKGKVDCIYIDPPYNTGAKDWKYNNDYVDGNDAYRHSNGSPWWNDALNSPNSYSIRRAVSSSSPSMKRSTCVSVCYLNKHSLTLKFKWCLV